MNLKRVINGLMSLLLGVSLIMLNGLGVHAQTIKIGANYELSGDVASFGTSAHNGFKLALQQANEAGGVLDGQELEGIVYDNKSDVSESLTVAERLVSDGVVAIAGPTTTGAAEAQIPAVQNNEVPVVFPSVTGEGVTEDNDGNVLDYVFRVCFNDAFQGTVGGYYASEEMNAQKVYVISDQSTDYSQGLASAFIKEFEEKGGEILRHESIDGSDTIVDASAILGNMLGQDFDLLYLPVYYEQAGQIIQQAREMGIDQPIVGGDGFSSKTLIDQAGPQNTNNVFYTTGFSPASEDEKVQEFLKDYQELTGEEPDAFAALGYDAAKIIIQAIEEAGEATPAAIQQALVAIVDFEGVTGTFSFDDLHNPIKPAIMVELADGEIKAATEVDPK